MILYFNKLDEGGGTPGGRARRLAAMAVLGLALTGCGVAPICSDVGQPYQGARELPPLRVPPGMTAPNRSGAMNVPPPPSTPGSDAAAAVRAAQRLPGKCLDEAPSYFGTAISPLSSPQEIVAVWAEAWSQRNADRMMSAYARGFVAPAGTDTAAWLEQRREQVATGPVPAPTVLDLRVTRPGPDSQVVTFGQQFEGSVIRRELTFTREAGFWRIQGERVLDLD